MGRKVILSVEGLPPFPAWHCWLHVRHGLTLVELLVTMAVVGVLIALVFPVMARSREKAHLALCRVHLRNIGTAALLYAGDHDASLPVVEVLDNPHAELIALLSGGGYVNGAGNYYCPSEWRPELSYSAENFDAGNIGYFYYACRRATSNRRVSTFLRWEVRWPRHLKADTHPETWIASDAWFSGEPTAHRRYKKGVNFVTLDGSVEMITRSPRGRFR